MVTAHALYFHIKNSLEKNGIESPQFEAMCIIEHIFGKKIDMLLIDRSEASAEQVNYVNNLIYKRISGEPLQYLLGEWEFFGMPFYVGKGVLIPRQDTETAVETVIATAKNYRAPRIIDLCSGSGCIACAVAANIDNAEVFALENSERALGYLNKNIALNRSDVTVIEADVLSEAVGIGLFDVIVCNPPYLTADDMKNLQKEVSFEPEEALFGGVDGLYFYREITRIWTKKLRTGGALVYEIGLGQENDVSEIMLENGISDIIFIKDLSGKIRVVKGIK